MRSIFSADELQYRLPFGFQINICFSRLLTKMVVYVVCVQGSLVTFVYFIVPFETFSLGDSGLLPGRKSAATRVSRYAIIVPSYHSAKLL